MPVKMQAGKGNLVFRRPFNGANRGRGCGHTPYIGFGIGWCKQAV